MKVKSLFFAMLLGVSTVFGQINLENTYTTDGDDAISFSFAVESGICYYTLSSSGNSVSIYNSSHVLYKTVTLSVTAGYSLEKIYLPTDKLFNADTKIEFIAVFSGTSDNKMILYNEDGTNLKEFGADRWSAYAVKVSTDVYKLMTVASSKTIPFSYDVYSVPGTLSALQESILKSQMVMTFPNPAENTLKISNIPVSNTSTSIDIYNENAVLVQQQTIAPNQNETIIDISALKNGFYMYKVNNITGKFIKK